MLRIPAPFRPGLGTRRFLLSLRDWRPYFPDTESKLRPWLPDSVVDEKDSVVLTYRTEPDNVDFYLGFLEALVEFYGERTFISVQTMRNEISFRCVFEV